MQDSLCGSIGSLLSARPRFKRSEDLHPSLSDGLPSNHHDTSSNRMDYPSVGEGSSTTTMIHTPQSLGSHNLSCWMEMIHELIEPAPEAMLFSPSREDVEPSSSSFGESSQNGFSPTTGSLDLDLQQLDSSKTAYEWQSSKPYVSEFFAGEPLPRIQRTIGNASSSEPFLQQFGPSNALHKVLSAPQLSHSKPTRSPRNNYPGTLSFPPTCYISNPLPVPNNQTLSNTQSSSHVSENSPYSSSPPKLPNSLPSMGYLSQKINQQQIRTTRSIDLHPQEASFLTSISMPASAISDPYEMFSPSQQRPTLPMMQSPKSMPHQDNGLRLVHLLLAAAESVAKQDCLGAKSALYELQGIVSITGDSIQRVAAYFTEALQSRLTGTGSRSYLALRSYDPAISDEVLAAYQILYQACPYVKFAHFISNQAIFEAFDAEEKVHIVDLDINQGYQWPAFIQALAARPRGAPRLRITGVGMPLQSVKETGKRLAELAGSLHVPFEFHAVGERLEDLRAHMLQRRVGEALAVNSVNRLHRLLSEPKFPLFGVLQLIRDQAPHIVTLVEQEASHNGPFFLGRFLEALHYYSAIFDSLDATLPQTSPERTKVEQLLFANEITNIVACEGPERVERHEKLDKWRKIMEDIGFYHVPLSANAVTQSKVLLGLYPCDGYTIVEDGGSLLLGWQDRGILSASAWRC